MAEDLKQESGRPGADRGGDRDHRSHHSARKIETAGPGRQIGDDEESQHRYDRACEPIEQLHDQLEKGREALKKAQEELNGYVSGLSVE